MTDKSGGTLLVCAIITRREGTERMILMKWNKRWELPAREVPFARDDVALDQILGAECLKTLAEGVPRRVSTALANGRAVQVIFTALKDDTAPPPDGFTPHSPSHLPPHINPEHQEILRILGPMLSHLFRT